MKNISLICLLLPMLFACKNAAKITEEKKAKENKPDVLYHYNIWPAFVNKIYDGTLSAKELKTKGDIALGYYNAMGGELIMLDGVLYQITEYGIMHKPDNSKKLLILRLYFLNQTNLLN